MAAKGSQLKEEITQKILATFPGSFKYDKEIRVPGIEAGEQLQIKVTLTCAKVNVEGGNGDVMPGETGSVGTIQASSASSISTVVEPSDEEKQRVKDLVERLGLA